VDDVLRSTTEPRFVRPSIEIVAAEIDLTCRDSGAQCRRIVGKLLEHTPQQSKTHTKSSHQNIRLSVEIFTECQEFPP
jgi:hypothetical protein